jgi:hypothetical protein
MRTPGRLQSIADASSAHASFSPRRSGRADTDWTGIGLEEGAFSGMCTKRREETDEHHLLLRLLPLLNDWVGGRGESTRLGLATGPDWQRQHPPELETCRLGNSVNACTCWLVVKRGGGIAPVVVANGLASTTCCLTTRLAEEAKARGTWRGDGA